MARVLQSWRHLKDCNVEGGRLRLTWAVENIIEVPGEPETGGGDPGVVRRRAWGADQTEYIPWCSELYDAFNDNQGKGRLLTEEQVKEILAKAT
jgi:hypothetical protein